MIFQFDIPNKPLNSKVFNLENPGFELYQIGNQIIISGDCSEVEAQAMLNAHNPPELTEPTVAQKLASVGLDFEELKAAILGGGN